MTMTFHWLGHATTDSARLCIRGASNGAITVACAGRSFSGTVDTAVRDGVAVVDVTGLSPGTSYPYTITDAAGASVAGSLKTMPASGGKVAFISCQDKTRALDDLAQQIVASGANAVKHQGDYIYTSAALSGYNGETTAAVTTGSAISAYTAHWRQCARKSENRLIETSVPCYRMFDDHEFGGDNWDHSVTQAQVSPNVASGGTQAEVDAAWWTGRQAAGYYMLGNPANSDGVSPEKPGAAAVGTSVDQYPVSYYRFTVGSIEVFCIDCFSYRSILTATDNASKTMLGANQKAWLKSRLDASTATFKIISSGKTTYSAGSTGTGDDWLKYTTERAELLAYISANASGNLRGVVWMAGDAHGAFVAYVPSNEHIMVCANPAGVDHIAQATGSQANIIWKEQGNSGTSTTLPAVFGLCEATATTLTISLINQYGVILWRGSVDAGTNVLRAPI